MTDISPYAGPQSVAETTLMGRLDEWGIGHETVEHAAFFTVDEGAVIKTQLPGGHTKNLFLKDKAGDFVLICALAETPVKLNKLHPHIGCKRLSFGKAEPMEAMLGVVPGSVTVFAVLNDTDAKVQLVLDQALMANEYVWFHPLRNTASTKIASADLVKFAEAAGHTPLILDLTALSND